MLQDDIPLELTWEHEYASLLAALEASPPGSSAWNALDADLKKLDLAYDVKVPTCRPFYCLSFYVANQQVPCAQACVYASFA